MTVPAMPSVREFRWRHTLANGVPGVLAALLLAAYLAALLHFDPASRRAFAWAVVAALAVLAPLGHFMERRAQRDVARALVSVAEGRIDDETLRAGYRAALRLPVEGLIWQAVCWPVASAVAILSFGLGLGEFDAFRSARDRLRLPHRRRRRAPVRLLHAARAGAARAPQPGLAAAGRRAGEALARRAAALEAGGADRRRVRGHRGLRRAARLHGRRSSPSSRTTSK